MDRPQYRAKALAWLHKFVKTQQEALEKNFNANRYSCQRSMRELLQHKDLAAVRAPALTNFPAGERKEWENFWNEVDTLLEKADVLIPEPAPGEKPSLAEIRRSLGHGHASRPKSFPQITSEESNARRVCCLHTLGV